MEIKKTEVTFYENSSEVKTIVFNGENFTHYAAYNAEVANGQWHEVKTFYNLSNYNCVYYLYKVVLKNGSTVNIFSADDYMGNIEYCPFEF